MLKRHQAQARRIPVKRIEHGMTAVGRLQYARRRRSATHGLDPQRRSELGALLKGLADQGRAILVSTHDEEFARDWTTGILRLKDGAVTEASGPR